MRRWKRNLGALSLAVGLAATSACGVLGGDDEPESDEARVLEMLNETTRLRGELQTAEFRLIQNCLEEQGFTVHNQYDMYAYFGDSDQDSLSDSYMLDEFLPEPEIAEEWGFGQWAMSPDGGDAWEEYEEVRYGEDENSFTDIDNSEFDSLPMEEQYDWYVAYYGEAYAQEQHGWLLMDEDEMMSDGGFEDGEIPEDGEVITEDGENGGELEFEDEGWVEPKAEGCKLDMILELYGEEPVLEEFGSGEEAYSTWTYGPRDPDLEGEGAWEELQLAYRDLIADEEFAFLDCIAERGHGDWSFNDWGGLDLWAFWNEVYFDDDGMVSYGPGSEPDYPEPSADIPEDFEGRKAYEIAMAVDFTECGDEVGFREAADEAWTEVKTEHYLDVADETFAFQEELQDAIERAQELIDA